MYGGLAAGGAVVVELLDDELGDEHDGRRHLATVYPQCDRLLHCKKLP